MTSKIRILGVDPGTIRMGWGVIEADGVELVHVAHGVLHASNSRPVEGRVAVMYSELQDVITNHKVHHIAYEAGFVGPYPKPAMAVAYARAVVMILAGIPGHPLYSYTPQEVKRAATQSGRATKVMVQDAMRIFIQTEFRPAEDAADALAVAICHAGAVRVQALIAGARE